MEKNVLSREEWKRRRRIKRNLLLAGLVVFCIVGIIIVIFLIKAVIGIFSSGSKPAEGDVAAKIKKNLSITENFLTANSKVRPGVKIKEVKNIVIHYSGSMGMDAKAKRDLYESIIKDEKAAAESMHYIVGLDGKIINVIPESEAALASAAKNSDSISIEYCYNDEAGTCAGNTYSSLVNLTAYLLAKYNLTTENIILHSDINGTVCPLYFVNNKTAWTNFLSDVRSSLTAAK